MRAGVQNHRILVDIRVYCLGSSYSAPTSQASAELASVKATIGSQIAERSATLRLPFAAAPSPACPAGAESLNG